ncbi:hypothetical protein LTR37_004106 [Vermiconidia calcicola]|uniref:Uncharacterized protein n=1 Tax=Vermiconidia calcicola TaxID=1690605 RepID=A0ACC3NN12_9PEZI|nr:hypothetical protein LTR37_004106 [Vermiconidia calcicola]
MKLSKIFGSICQKIRCDKFHTASPLTSTGANGYVLSIHGPSTGVEASNDIEPPVATPSSALMATTCWDTRSQTSRALSQRSNASNVIPAPAFSTATAPSYNRIEQLNHEVHGQLRPASANLLLPIQEVPDHVIELQAEEVKSLQAEVERLSLAFYEHKTEIKRLEDDLERTHSVVSALQESKCSSPRKLKKQVAGLAKQLNYKEHEVEEWRRKYSKLAWTLGVRDQNSRVKDLLEKTVQELEANAAEWGRRMEDVGKKSRDVERKARGLGMWWVGNELDGVVNGSI